MRILLASSEVHPYSKTGGLADMVGALAKALAAIGHRVGLVTPLYKGIRERFNPVPYTFPLDVPLGIRRVKGEIWTLDPAENLTLYFVDQPEFYQRAALYQQDGQDYPDNAERFMFFAKAVTELGLHLTWRPQLVHAHDWQAAFAALLLHHQRQHSSWAEAPRTCLTIHNLAYQGVFPASQFALSNLPWTFFDYTGVEFYGRMNCLKAGIAYADNITTVSPRYAKEITTEEFGCGLDPLLRQKSKKLRGILNGVDYSEWDPSTDPFISRNYTPENLAGKAWNKAALQEEMGLPVNPDAPLFGNIGRMVEQKGISIMLTALETLLARGENFQYVLLGNGAPESQRAFQHLAKVYPRQVAVHIGFSEELSHKVEAGVDYFVMPSRFEPCGLNQMYSLRYGSIPIVRAVGGLDDSVIDPREEADLANGIKFHDYTTPALAKAMHKAMALFGDPKAFAHFRRNAMHADFSWGRTAQDYVDIYEQTLK